MNNDESGQQSDATDAALPRVIVVEDHADTLVMMGKLLSMVPVDGLPVASCAAARHAARTLGAFEVAIADVTLPDGDGVELLAELKRTYQCRTVAMSGYDPPEGSLPPGVDLWIAKPVDLRGLRRAIEALNC